MYGRLECNSVQLLLCNLDECSTILKLNQCVENYVVKIEKECFLHSDTSSINKSLKNSIDSQIKFKELLERVDLFIVNACDKANDYVID